jgi:anion transporter
LLATTVLAAAVLLYVWPMFTGVNEELFRAGALVVATIGLWASGVLPEYVTGLGFLLGAVLLQVAEPAVAFSGFFSTALWLVFGGLVIGFAVGHTGLGERIARVMLARLSLSFAGVISGMVAVSVVLSFVIPSSMGRTVVLMPIGLAIADRLGFVDGSRGRSAIAMAIGFGVVLPGFAILPANVPQIILAGAAETNYGLTITYAEYLLLHFPLVGLVKAGLIAAVIILLFRDTPKPAPADEANEPATRRQRILTWIVLITLALWFTDSIHHVSPAWVALGAAILLLIPAFGVLPARAFRCVNFAPMFYVAGVLGVGALVTHSGLGAVIGGKLIGLISPQPGDTVTNVISLVAVAMGTGLVTTLAGLPAVLTPLAQDFANATGLPLLTVLMTQVIGFSTVILPYSSPPLILAFAMGGVRLADGTRLCITLAAITLVVLMPINFLWWQLLGYFG